ncbi:hypothetical protein [Candidatus Phytoplasma pruni]|uniref:Immunodominant membrane protein n=1 Tax=Candidatus Phytoplasma pruni TaxID=479893 RepID=A0A851HIE9_9MOLU|nr:hypothetical protein [Candidatus Phytoplasma pruni]NWN45603.1 hypothetical protein [Candidatus Phytoplasma pruni]
MAAMDKQNKQSYLKTKNGKIVLGVVSAVVVLLVGVGAYLLMRTTPTKAVNNLQTKLVDKWDEVVTNPVNAANGKTEVKEKATGLKKVVSTLNSYAKTMEDLTKDANKPKDDTKKAAYERAQAAVKLLVDALKPAVDEKGNDQAAVDKMNTALRAVSKDQYKTAVDEVKTAYEIK